MQVNRSQVKVSTAKKREKTYRFLGVLVFCLGVLLGIGLLGASVYADFEASLFDIPLTADESIRPFTCPILIDKDEVGIVRATVKNDSDQPILRTITGHFSQYSVVTRREEIFRTNFDPFETKNISWEITADDAVYGHLILVKVYLYGRASNPAREAGCGVLVLDLPLNMNGNQMVVSLLIMGVTMMLVGGRVWWIFTHPKSGIRAEESWGVLSLVSAISIGLLASYLGFFTISAGMFYIAVLMVGVMVPHFLFSRWRV